MIKHPDLLLTVSKGAKYILRRNEKYAETRCALRRLRIHSRLRVSDLKDDTVATVLCRADSSNRDMVSKWQSASRSAFCCDYVLSATLFEARLKAI